MRSMRSGHSGSLPSRQGEGIANGAPRTSLYRASKNDFVADKQNGATSDV